MVKQKPVPNKQGLLRLDKTHRMFYQSFGNPQGHTFVFLHGGPGYHSTLGALENFDLRKDHVILFDQRGCGKSKPLGSIKNNNTSALCGDITKLLNHLKITDKVTLYGGSWGTTLALVYAIRNPLRVANLILRGVFLGRKKDVEAIYYPKKSWTDNQKIKYEMTLGRLVSKFNLKDVVKDSLRIIKKGDKNSDYFFSLWAMYEDMICSNRFELNFPDKEYLKIAKVISIIETYYFSNNCFLEKNYILNNVDRLKNIKTYIIHGEQDMVCPVKQATTRHKALKRSKLHLDPKGGHSASTGNLKAKVKKVVTKIRKNQKSVSK